MALAIREAYEKGWRSQATASDWDAALDRFTRKYCSPHRGMCDLEHAWASGWSDRSADRPRGHALRCDRGGIRDGHDTCL